MTLRWRLSLALAAAVALGAVVFSLAARQTVEHLLYDDVDRQLSGEVRRVLGRVRIDDDAGRFGRPVPGPRRGRGIFGGRGPGAVFGRDATFAQVLDANGEIAMQTTSVEAIGGLPEPEVDAGDRGALAVHTARIDGRTYRIADAVGRNGVIVQVARPLNELDDFLDKLMWVLVAAGGTALGAALLLGPWVARATLRPVERMTSTAQSIARSPRDLSRRVEPAFPDIELREFADAMNEMLESIEQADLHQRRFVADASHELRTPLTSLGGNASYLERTAQLDDDAREAVGAVRRDVERLIRIADGMTMLARLDATPTSQAEPCDVGDLARDAVERFARLYPDHTFAFDGTTGMHLLDVELVRRIVDNLVDNAGRYTPAGTTVRVTVASDEDAVTLDVVDDGPGLGATERERAIERFHRGSTAAGVSGTGLGLAIVDEAARALGGSLLLEEGAPHGLLARVELRSTPRTDG